MNACEGGGVYTVHTAVGLVAAVLAVGVPVAPPLHVDALSREAGHLAGRALGRRRRVAAAARRRLVRLILQGHKSFWPLSLPFYSARL